MRYPKLNQNIKWRFDYSIASKKSTSNRNQKKIIDALLDRFYEDVDFAVKNKFREYIAKVSELNSSFFVLTKRYRRKLLGEREKYLFELTENVYKE